MILALLPNWTMSNPSYSHLGTYLREAQHFPEVQVEGRVTHMIGQIIESYNPGSAIGSLCKVFNPIDQSEVLAEVVGFRKDKMLLMPLENVRNINPKCRVIPEHRPPMVPVGDDLLGKVVDPLFQPLGDQPDFGRSDEVPLYRDPPNPMERRRIEKPLDVGIRAINGCLTCGRGQRIGILAGSGVGKSVLLGMMAQHTDADVNVIALIGERGREVKDFIERDLGEEGMQRSVMIVATSDQPPLLRMRGAFAATAVAEYFCEKGLSVLLMMDSATRFAMAQREVGLAAGEPPTTKGYPPSVFALLPKLLERAGTTQGEGSITAFYTVLVEGDDTNDPIADSIRSIVDGHIVLSRDIASRGHYPAIDISLSASRVMTDVTSRRHIQLAQLLRQTLSTYREAEDLINIGAYVKGSNPEIDYALSKYSEIQSFLRQNFDERASLAETELALQQIFGDRLQ